MSATAARDLKLGDLVVVAAPLARYHGQPDLEGEAHPVTSIREYETCLGVALSVLPETGISPSAEVEVDGWEPVPGVAVLYCEDFEVDPEDRHVARLPRHGEGVLVEPTEYGWTVRDDYNDRTLSLRHDEIDYHPEDHR